MSELLAKDWFLWGAVLIVIFPLAAIVLGEASDRLRRRQLPMEGVARQVRNLVLPLVVLFFFLTRVLGFDTGGVSVRMIETALWLGVLWVALSAVSALVFQGAEAGSWRARTPKLFLDLTRFFMVLVGAAFVLSAVWNRDLGGLLAALGVGSIVLGFALQDTLGNLMAGIALLFERPFGVGDWIKVGNIEGAVVEMNWRSVRLRTLERDLMVVPNSVLGKEIITNTNQPTTLHAERIPIAFSFDAPPNRVKQVLEQVALSLPDVVHDPAPKVETMGYGDDRILYEAKLYTENLRRIPRIRDGFTTRAWYAAQRHGLKLPMPMRTVFSLELDPESQKEVIVPVTAEELAAVPALATLEAADLENAAREATRLRFASREDVLLEGERSEAVYAILAGRCSLLVREGDGAEREVVQLSSGEVFGERSLLSHEPSPATITALEDLEVARIPSGLLREALDRSAVVARVMAELIDGRAKALDRVRRAGDSPVERSPQAGTMPPG
jgi:small-conductance mechanosensitive channel